MKNWSAKIARTLRIALVLGAAFSLTGCGPLFTLRASLEEWDKQQPEGSNNVTPLKDDEMANALADKFGLMALFAQVSYHADLNEGERDSACNRPDHDYKGDATLYFYAS